MGHRVECGSLMRMAPHRLTFLNTWSPLVESFGRYGFVRGVSLRADTQVSKTCAIFRVPSFPAACGASCGLIDELFMPPHVCSAIMDSNPLKVINPIKHFLL